jgi:amphiregulin
MSTQQCSLTETEVSDSSLLILSVPAGHYAAALELNDPSSGKGESLSGDHSAGGLELSVGREVSTISEMPSGSELSTGDYDYSEEYDNEPQISGYIIDDSVRGEWRAQGKRCL